MITKFFLLSWCSFSVLVYSLPTKDSSSSPSIRRTALAPLSNYVFPLRHATRHLVRPSRIHQRQDDEDLGPPAVGVGRALSAAKGIEYIIDVEIAGEDFSLIIDTGSSDTWVAGDEFRCVNWMSSEELDIEECHLGPLLEQEVVEETLIEEPFNIQYADGSFVDGVFGYADISVSEVKIPELQVGIATRGFWPGDNITSGILGLGLRNLTQRRRADGFYSYDPLVETMQDHEIPPVFSMMLSRNDEESFLAFGGIPPDIETGESVSTPIIKDAEHGYLWYSVQPEQIVANSSKGRAVSNSPPEFVVDCGTTQSLFSFQNADIINSLFDPPAKYSSRYGAWFVECDAKPPSLGFKFEGKMIYNNPEYMILPELIDEATGLCATGIGVSPEPSIAIIGQTFMQGHLFVFDISEDIMEVRIVNLG